MKARLALVLVLTVTAGISSSFAAAPRSNVALSEAALGDVPCGFVVRNVNISENVEIARGATSMTVRRLLGTPLKALSPDVWTYSGYHPELSDEAKAYGCDTLLVTFADGKVVDLKIVNLKATQVIAANLKPDASFQQIAKAKK